MDDFAKTNVAKATSSFIGNILGMGIIVGVCFSGIIIGIIYLVVR